jgi:hypothetical protein
MGPSIPGTKGKIRSTGITGALCGGIEIDQRKSLLAAADCIERAANYSWWDWEDGSIPFFGDGMSSIIIR